jgi:hypothetical protein
VRAALVADRLEARQRSHEEPPLAADDDRRQRELDAERREPGARALRLVGAHLVRPAEPPVRLAIEREEARRHRRPVLREHVRDQLTQPEQ